MKHKTDIIIPIYNAYDCLRPCIDSVIKNTDLNKNRIILIDDKSPDERVLPLLESYSNNNSIIVLKNDENLGFVKTVNKGMKYSVNDVLLLNSDTEVTNNWLQKIQDCAYKEKMIGTVTPLSNNATLVSVPHELTKNELPKNMSLDEYSKIIEMGAYNENPELPTTHGFCMFIKREVLNLIGLFDEESFGTGYGEENEFSFRCLDYGYKNVMCDNVIVYHKESQSFSKKREEVIEEHSKILKDRYPIYFNQIDYWCRLFPIKKHCLNIEHQINMYNRKNILVLIHDWSNLNSNYGGTTLHVKDLIDKLRDKYNFHVLSPSDCGYSLYSYYEDSMIETDFPFVENYNITGFYNTNYKQMLQKIVIGFRIDTIHVHHMLHHYMDIIDIAKENKILSIISLHDFYSICPTVNLLYNRKKYCINLKEKNCKECLKLQSNYSNNIIDVWQKNWNDFLMKFDKIIAPSNSCKETLSLFYKNINIDVIEHGILLEKSDYYPSINAQKNYNIAFIGVMAGHKGAEILQKINYLSNGKYIFHLFGDSFYEDLKHNRKNYKYHGTYKRNNIEQLLKDNKIDLVCILSICPETYSYTLSEVFASNIPVLGFNIGAVGERIKKEKLGYVMDLTNDETLVFNKIEEIFEDKEKYKEIVEKYKKYKLRDTISMSKDYEEYYKKSKFIAQNEENSRILRIIIKDTCNSKLNGDSVKLQKILDSYRWKIASKIKIPKIVSRLLRGGRR